LLCLLIAAAASLVKSYAPTLLTVLVRTAQSPDNSTIVSAECVKCIGELARVAGEELISSAKSVIDLVISMLNDHTSPLKRNAALKTLGQLASNTASVVQPYLDHPQLLGVLFRLLRTESDGAVRLETIRTMGMLGALDPFKHKKLIQGGGGLDDAGAMATGQVGGSGANASGVGTGTTNNQDAAGGAGGPARVTDIMLLMNTMTPSNEDFYQTVAVHCLVSVLNDPTMKENHYEAVEAVMLIFRTQRLRCVSFLPQVSSFSRARRRSLAVAKENRLNDTDPACFPARHSHCGAIATRCLSEAARQSDIDCEATYPQLPRRRIQPGSRLLESQFFASDHNHPPR
jgi:FKBP12-rapamycin complex-associated protein